MELMIFDKNSHHSRQRTAYDLISYQEVAATQVLGETRVSSTRSPTL